MKSTEKSNKAKPSKALSNISAYRQKSGASQDIFWQRLGCTQSGGSRYEGGRSLPPPLSILLVLIEQGIVSEEQLTAARETVKATNVSQQKGG